MKKTNHYLVSGIMLAVTSSPAFAQTEPASDASSADDGSVLQEIVVTATKRAERLQNVSIAVSAVSSEDLANSAIVSPSDLKIPGVQFITQSSRSTLSIRGVSSAGNPGFDQAVPVYIDGVYFGRGGTARGGFLDVERVEVLRGPQPTYLGKNAIAGALSVISKRPGDELEGNITAFHEFEANEENIEAGITIPVSSTFSTRFAGRYRDLDGWVENVSLGNDGPSTEQWQGRASALWQPNDRFSLYAKYDYTKLKASGTDRELWNCGVLAPINSGVIGPNDDCRLDGRTANMYAPELFPLVSAVGGNDPSYGRFTLQGGVVEAEYGANTFTVTATGSYYKLDMFDRLNVDASERTFSVISTVDDSTQKSIELRAASSTNGRFSWLVGGYADAIDLDLQVPGGVYLVGPGDPRFSPGPGFFIDSKSKQKERSWSLYGEVGYEVLDGLTFKLAGRYSKVDKTLKAFNLNSLIGVYDPVTNSSSAIPGTTVFPVISIANDKRTYKDFQPAITVEYRPSNGVLLFASYKEGFKAGGFDLDAFFLNPNGDLQFTDETVKAYEIGAKIDFLRGRARLNVTGFRADYDDLQVNIFNGLVGSFTANAATARAQGVEIEAQVSPVRGLVLLGTLNYLDSTYGSFPSATCFPGQTAAQGCVGGNFQDLSGKERVLAPKWSGTLGAEFTAPADAMFGLGSEFEGGFNVFFTSRYATQSTLGPYAYQESYQTLDGHLGFTFNDAKYGVKLIGRNLTNEKVYDNYQPTAASGNSTFSAALRRTRQLALQLSARF